MLKISRPEWQRHAACRTVDTRLFFSNGAQEAKRICADCPVVQQCLDFAIADFGLEGIWGGLTVAERDVERRRRNTRSN